MRLLKFKSLRPLLGVRILLLCAIVALAACKEKPPEGAHVPTQSRTDFAPDEFGIGRAHTKSRACNREIDRLLDEVRQCFNSRPAGECEPLQQATSQRIGKLKNSARCQH